MWYRGVVAMHGEQAAGTSPFTSLLQKFPSGKGVGTVFPPKIETPCIKQSEDSPTGSLFDVVSRGGCHARIAAV